MRHAIFSLFLILFSGFSFGQTQVNIGGDFTSGIFTTWTVIDGDGLTPAAAVSQFGSAWIHYMDATDTCAASTSYYDPAGQSADYLITPKLSLATHTKITWRAKSYDASYPDGYYVLISTTDSLPASFTDTLLTVSAENVIWTYHSLHLEDEGYANQDVYLAFRNNTTDGYILMIDDVEMYVSDFTTVSQANELEFKVFPNPSAEEIHISNKNFDTFNIYSFDGQLVMTSTESTIDISGLNTGTYIIQGVSESGVYTTQFVKQ